jgi:DNA-binding transcriptional regulator YhcF (GntR family)
MTDRRFNEEEVAAIFKQATESKQTPQRQLPSGEGLTLAELQEIGQQVGIAPELVARAATSLAEAGTATSRKFLGLTVSVGRTVELDRKLTEDEWDRLVVDLRETFDRRGTVRVEGSFRQWTVGNLQVLLEPTPTGQRIRMRTVKGSAQAWMMGGMLVSGMAVVATIAATIGGAPNKLSAAAILAVIAAGQFSIAALQLPGWARLRRKQMEEIAQRLTTSQSLLPPQT